ncbi:MAG TPA: DinB family protein [Pirellulales bacterium]|jgi:hypothetical protein|nr:DinB family protein [Pirellulales bacterium]
MNARDAIKLSIDSADMIAMGYLNDLSDKDLLQRPCLGCNHINWQVGHLVAAEHKMMEQVAPGAMPKLPDGFDIKYSKETATVDDPKKLCAKAELLQLAKQQREGTLKALAKTSEADLDKPTGIDYAPTVGAVYAMQGTHWLMHVGQWAVVRRQLGRKPLF